jgi:putative glutamine amidotransferase
MSRPLVGLACATETIDGVPHAAVRNAYVTALREVAGCAVVLIPGSGEHVADILGHLHGLVLGGHETNVAAEHYGGRAATGPRDEDRDALALSAARLAVHAGLPLLGICRGLQELNVALGGTLRDLGQAHREDLSLPRDEQYLPAHEVRTTDGGLLRELLGGRESVAVNSLHQQAVDRLAPRLRVEAVTGDGVVEAASVAEAGTFALAVQWHPEWYARQDEVSRRIFEGFGAAAEKAAAG